MKALIGSTLKEAREIAKKELGVKRMGEARFQMILDEGIKKGDFSIQGDLIVSASVDTFFDFEEAPVEEAPVEVEEAPVEVSPVELSVKVTHPEDAHIDPKLASSDLPRPGDMYFYRSYTGDVVQGEVVSVICFAECKNPDGTWQSVALQDLHIKAKGVPRDTMLNHLRAYYEDNRKLADETANLRRERDRLLAEIEDLKK